MKNDKQLAQPKKLRTICGISSGMKAEHFFILLQKNKVTRLIDTRLHRAYQQARFSHEKDLAYLCQVHNIEYQFVPELAPTQEMREQFHKTWDGVKKEERKVMAWTYFLQAYAKKLIDDQFLAVDQPTRMIVDGDDEVVAFLCACQHYLDCHRQVILGMLKRFVSGLEVMHLSPEMVEGKKPNRKSPRRYLLQDISQALLKSELQQQEIK